MSSVVSPMTTPLRKETVREEARSLCPLGQGQQGNGLIQAATIALAYVLLQAGDDDRGLVRLLVLAQELLHQWRVVSLHVANETT